MSETIKHGAEHSHEKIDLTAESRKNIEQIHERAENAKEASSEDIHHLTKKAETQAISGKEYTVGENESIAHAFHHASQKELKAQSFNKSMRYIRKNLSTPDRALSKVIHNKTVDSLSEIGGKTVARPSGVLGGGIFALMGSAFLLYMANHYGFEYNYFLFFVLFIGGYFLGMIVELVFRAIIKKA